MEVLGHRKKSSCIPLAGCPKGVMRSGLHVNNAISGFTSTVRIFLTRCSAQKFAGSARTVQRQLIVKYLCYILVRYTD